MVSGGVKCIKYLLFLFNLILFLGGISVSTAGALVQIKYSAYFKFFDGSAVNTVGIVLIAVGFVIFTVGFFGCCGAYKENHCMVLTFSVLLGVVFILEIAVAVSAHMLKPKIDTLVRDTMIHTIKSYTGNEEVRDAWNSAQSRMKCCGVNNYTDWAENFIVNNSVPDSCCIKFTPSCGYNLLQSEANNIFPQGCANTLLIASQRTVIILLSIAAAVGVMQATGIGCSCYLARAIWRDDEVNWAE